MIKSLIKMDSLIQTEKEIKSCSKCKLHLTKREYVPGIIGSKFPRTVFVGEAPGAYEDIAGEPFVGRSGQLLSDVIFHAMNMNRGEYTILNTVKCRPPNNRDPSDYEKKTCFSHLREQIRALMPCTIITLGRHAGNSFSYQKTLSMRELSSIWLFDAENQIRVIPCYHPSYILRNISSKNMFIESLKEISNGSFEYARDRVGFSFFPSRPKDFN